MAQLRLKLSSPQEVRRALSRVSNMVLNGTIDPKAANSIIAACNSILGAIRIDEQERKIQELEQLVEDYKKSYHI